MLQAKSSIRAINLLCIAALLVIALRGVASNHIPDMQNATAASNLVYVNGKFYTACANGYLNEQQQCMPLTVPTCPTNHVLINGYCYLQNQLPQQICPNGYYLFNNLCHPIAPVPCPAAAAAPSFTAPEIPPIPPIPIAIATTTSTTMTPLQTSAPTTTTTTTSTTTTTHVPPPAAIQLQRCPPESIFTNGQCRKILCPLGEYYEGSCLQPACPETLVWRGGSCQEPGYITTILEIENVFRNEEHDSQAQIKAPINVNNVEHFTHKPPPAAIKEPCKNKTGTTTIPPPPANILLTTTTKRTLVTSPALSHNEGCCHVITPRLCKQYGERWVCFNRRKQLCDVRICKSRIMYLKISKVVYKPPLLIMPPNPPLEACIKPGCEASDTIDCSGCQHNQREKCSPYCYNYVCKSNDCNFVDWKEYCNYYPGDFGCIHEDGCIWDWCR